MGAQHPRSAGRPIGLEVTRTAKAVGMAFNAALQVQGGSVPVWLILNALTHEKLATQLDQLLGQLRLGQVNAEREASRPGEPEDNDLDQIPTQPAAGTA